MNVRTISTIVAKHALETTQPMNNLQLLEVMTRIAHDAYRAGYDNGAADQMLADAERDLEEA